MNKEKIAIIDHVGSKAGMDYYTHSLAKGFQNNNQAVFIYSNFSKKNTDFITYKKTFNRKKISKIIQGFSFLKSIIHSNLDARINKVDYAIINIFSSELLTLFLAILTKINFKKLIVIAHDLESFKGNDIRIIQKIIYNNLADSIVVHNKFCKTKLSEKIDNSNKINIIKQGGYISYFGNMPTIDNAHMYLNLDDSKKYILFFGQIKKEKGLDVLLNALSNVHDNIYLIIAGKNTDSNFAYYNHLIKENNIESRVIIKNYFISNDEMKHLFSASSAIILPYKKIYQSAVILMSMSLNLPVIASDLKPIKEVIINNFDGITFSSENTHELAKKINTTLFDKKLLQKISKNALMKIEKDFNWNSVANHYVKLINKL